MDIEVEAAIIEHIDRQDVSSGIAFTAGLASGVAGIIVGQPFDTVRVRLQTAPPTQYNGAIDCVKEAVRHDGVRSLFRGIGPPLASAALINAIVFSVYGSTHQWLQNRRGGMAGSVRTGDNFLAGSLAGASQAMVVLPADNIKTKLQTSNMYRGPIDCARQLLATQGPRALMAGGNATYCREIPAYGIYFGVYEKVKAALLRFDTPGNAWGGGLCAFAAGGTAGCCSWLTIYPIDVIKSKQQATLDTRSPMARSMVECARAMYREGGIHPFLRGLPTTMVRAFPVNAVVFPAYEWTVRALTPIFGPQKRQKSVGVSPIQRQYG